MNGPVDILRQLYRERPADDLLAELREAIKGLHAQADELVDRPCMDGFGRFFCNLAGAKWLALRVADAIRREADA